MNLIVLVESEARLIKMLECDPRAFPFGERIIFIQINSRKVVPGFAEPGWEILKGYNLQSRVIIINGILKVLSAVARCQVLPRVSQVVLRHRPIKGKVFARP